MMTLLDTLTVVLIEIFGILMNNALQFFVVLFNHMHTGVIL